MKKQLPFLILALAAILFSCTENTTPLNLPTSVSFDELPLDLDTLYSRTYKGTETFSLKTTDTLKVNIAGHPFNLSDPNLMYIKDGLNIQQMFGGSWVYAMACYNDTNCIRLETKELYQDSIFSFPTAIDSLNKLEVSKFDLNFYFYVDNGKGEILIEKFPIEISE